MAPFTSCPLTRISAKHGVSMHPRKQCSFLVHILDAKDQRRHTFACAPHEGMKLGKPFTHIMAGADADRNKASRNRLINNATL
eukprot:1145163-Pelagomonas_calceolata.AAC.3